MQASAKHVHHIICRFLYSIHVFSLTNIKESVTKHGNVWTLTALNVLLVCGSALGSLSGWSGLSCSVQNMTYMSVVCRLCVFFFLVLHGPAPSIDPGYILMIRSVFCECLYFPFSFLLCVTFTLKYILKNLFSKSDELSFILTVLTDQSLFLSQEKKLLCCCQSHLKLSTSSRCSVR